VAKKMSISFKDNERDTILLNEIMTHGDRSNFIKDCVQLYIDTKFKGIKTVGEVKI